jgi:hypothetical protein
MAVQLAHTLTPAYEAFCAAAAECPASLPSIEAPKLTRRDGAFGIELGAGGVMYAGLILDSAWPLIALFLARYCSGCGKRTKRFSKPHQVKPEDLGIKPPPAPEQLWGAPKASEAQLAEVAQVAEAEVAGRVQEALSTLSGVNEAAAERDRAAAASERAVAEEKRKAAEETLRRAAEARAQAAEAMAAANGRRGVDAVRELLVERSFENAESRGCIRVVRSTFRAWAGGVQRGLRACADADAGSSIARAAAAEKMLVGARQQIFLMEQEQTPQRFEEQVERYDHLCHSMIRMLQSRRERKFLRTVIREWRKTRRNRIAAEHAAKKVLLHFLRTVYDMWHHCAKEEAVIRTQGRLLKEAEAQMQELELNTAEASKSIGAIAAVAADTVGDMTEVRDLVSESPWSKDNWSETESEDDAGDYVSVDPVKTSVALATQRVASAGEGTVMALWDELEPLMRQSQIDWTLFWRQLAVVAELDPAAAADAEAVMAPLADAFYGELPAALVVKWAEWLRKYHQTLGADGPRAEAAIRMRSVNPKYVPREWMLVEAYDLAAEGDYSLVIELNTLFKQPYAEQPDMEAKYYRRAPDAALTSAGTAFMS